MTFVGQTRLGLREPRRRALRAISTRPPQRDDVATTSERESVALSASTFKFNTLSLSSCVEGRGDLWPLDAPAPSASSSAPSSPARRLDRPSRGHGGGRRRLPAVGAFIGGRRSRCGALKTCTVIYSTSKKGRFWASVSPFMSAPLISRVSRRDFHYCSSSTTADSGSCIFTEVTECPYAYRYSKVRPTYLPPHVFFSFSFR